MLILKRYCVHHPDAGGDPETFKRLREARMVR